jgi:phage tail sheath protein FI
MPEYLAPGVFVEEVSFRPSAIQPASTSVAAIVGPTRTGPIRGQPQLLTSFADYQSIFGDPLNLTFSDAGSTLNYTAYAAWAFFNNGGQQLYLSRITNDVMAEGPASGRPATAAVAVSSGGNVLIDLIARFPGSGGNVDVVFQPRRSQRMLALSPAPATDTTDTVMLRLTNVAAASLLGSTLAAGAFPLSSVIAAAKLFPASGGAPAQYDFVAGEPIIYVDQSGTSHVAQIAAFATGVLASAVTGASTAQVVTLQAPTDAGAAPLYSIPVGTNIRSIFNLPATVTTLYGTVASGVVTLTKAANPTLAADTQAPLAVFAMGSRTGDGNIYHDSYDISVQVNGLPIYSFPDVDLEQDAVNNLSVALTNMPATGSARVTQPIYATYTGTVGAAALWASMMAAFDQTALHPTNPAVAPSYVLHLTGGTDGGTPQTADYAGEVDEVNGSFGLAALEAVDEISIVLCPAVAIDSANHQSVSSAIEAHCTKMLYRVGVLDSPKGAAVADVQQFGGQFSDSRLALYYPWILAATLGPGGGQVLLPPSGFVAGVYAYTDISRGVFKAPANEVVQGAVGLETYINTGQQEILNPLGINCIRFFPSRGYRVWGARTLSDDPQWQYVNVRRYFLYLEHSIADSTSWVVFEPNGQALWSSVAGSVSDFLYNEWSSGSLFGAKPAEAYFVRCDQTTMTQADLENGRLVCVIGVAPLEPAEFVIFRIGQWTATS